MVNGVGRGWVLIQEHWLLFYVYTEIQKGFYMIKSKLFSYWTPGDISVRATNQSKHYIKQTAVIAYPHFITQTLTLHHSPTFPLLNSPPPPLHSKTMDQLNSVVAAQLFPQFYGNSTALSPSALSQAGFPIFSQSPILGHLQLSGLNAASGKSFIPCLLIFITIYM